MKKTPLISIIVPIYNGEKYISECITSIISQHFKNIEIILVNDGSSDKSGEIIHEFGNKDQRIKIINQDNKGVCVARNTALNVAHGKYICLIDQDDYIAPDYISYLYDLIVTNNAQISLIPQAIKFTSTTKQSEKKGRDKEDVWSGQEAVKQMLYYNIIISPWNKMFSRELINSNGIRFAPDLFGGEGFLFSINCLAHAKNVAVGYQKKYYYRVDNPNSGMTKFSLKVIKSSIEAQKRIKDSLLYEYPELLSACKYANWHTCCDCYNTIVGCEVISNYPKIYKELKQICKKDAVCVITAKVCKKEQLKGILYFINPYIAAKCINHFRIRKFSKGE